MKISCLALGVNIMLASMASVANELTADQKAAEEASNAAVEAAVAAAAADAKANALAGDVKVKDVEEGTNLDQFGFGPALFVIAYSEEVLMDSKDVRLRGDGSISSSGSSYSTALGFEVHYGFSFANKVKCRTYRCENTSDYVESSGHTVSPFLGLYDVENGINGVVVGVVYGYWRGDGNYQNRTSLNVGVGYTVHKDRLVLGRGVKEGVAPPAGLVSEDYTERKDVDGITLMISASLGF